MFRMMVKLDLRRNNYTKPILIAENPKSLKLKTHPHLARIRCAEKRTRTDKSQWWIYSPSKRSISQLGNNTQHQL